MMAAILLQASGGGFGGFLIPLGLMFAIMYFMVIMPQQRQRKKVQSMLAELKSGDKVITNGGIYGTVNGIDGDSVILKISSEPQVKIRIASAPCRRHAHSCSQCRSRPALAIPRHSWRSICHRLGHVGGRRRSERLYLDASSERRRPHSRIDHDAIARDHRAPHQRAWID